MALPAQYCALDTMAMVIIFERWWRKQNPAWQRPMRH